MVNFATITGASTLVHMAIKSLKFGEEIRIWKVAVNDPNGVIGIESGDQDIPGGFNRLHMSRCYIAGSTNQCEISHVYLISNTLCIA